MVMTAFNTRSNRAWGEQHLLRSAAPFWMLSMHATVTLALPFGHVPSSHPRDQMGTRLGGVLVSRIAPIAAPAATTMPSSGPSAVCKSSNEVTARWLKVAVPPVDAAS